MDQLARQHVERRLKAAQRRHARAVEDLAQFVQAAQQGYMSTGWHNLATTVALGAYAAGEVDAYTTALATADAEAADPKPAKEQP
jgi:hypothetical protein